MRRTIGMLAVAAAVAIGTSAQAQSGPATAYEWRQISVTADPGTYTHPVTGKGLVPSMLDQAEAIGWEFKGITARTHLGYEFYDLLFRAPVGQPWVSLPASKTAAPAPQRVAPPAQAPTYGTSCPGYPRAPFPGARCYADGGWRTPEMGVR